MQEIFNGRAYKQDYKIRKDEYQLVGDHFVGIPAKKANISAFQDGKMVIN